MKNEYSRSWKRSTQPRKQRKYQYNAPKDRPGEFLSVHLNKELRQKHGVRAIRVRTGDKVKVLCGTHRGKDGKVDSIDTRNRKVIVNKIEMLKKEGGKMPYPLTPSNLMITELASDKRRFKRSKKVEPKKEK